jgi:hypothetical protein
MYYTFSIIIILLLYYLLLLLLLLYLLSYIYTIDMIHNVYIYTKLAIFILAVHLILQYWYQIYWKENDGELHPSLATVSFTRSNTEFNGILHCVFTIQWKIEREHFQKKSTLKYIKESSLQWSGANLPLEGNFSGVFLWPFFLCSQVQLPCRLKSSHCSQNFVSDLGFIFVGSIWRL